MSISTDPAAVQDLLELPSVPALVAVGILGLALVIGGVVLDRVKHHGAGLRPA